MKKQELEAFAREVAKGLKTEEDLNEFSQMLTKVTVEAALNAELEDHLGYARHEPSENANSRNGYGSKTLTTGEGQFELETLRDRQGQLRAEAGEEGTAAFHLHGRSNPEFVCQGHDDPRDRGHVQGDVRCGDLPDADIPGDGCGA